MVQGRFGPAEHRVDPGALPLAAGPVHRLPDHPPVVPAGVRPVQHRVVVLTLRSVALQQLPHPVEQPGRQPPLVVGLQRRRAQRRPVRPFPLLVRRGLVPVVVVAVVLVPVVVSCPWGWSPSSWWLAVVGWSGRGWWGTGWWRASGAPRGEWRRCSGRAGGTGVAAARWSPRYPPGSGAAGCGPPRPARRAARGSAVAARPARAGWRSAARRVPGRRRSSGSRSAGRPGRAAADRSRHSAAARRWTARYAARTGRSASVRTSQQATTLHLPEGQAAHLAAGLRAGAP